jgi:hypothetical protein
MNAHRVARTKVRDILAQLRCLDLFDRIHRILRNKNVRW